MTTLPPGPLAKFASGLQALKRDRGITYRKMAAMANYHHAVLCRAARGKEFPTLQVTLAYVAACGGSQAEWTVRWRETRELLRAREGRS